MTVTEMADRIGIGSSTLRDWTRIFGDYLSDSATPPAGKRRKYTKEDERVLAFIHEKKRRERISDDAIIEALESGEVSSHIPAHWREPGEEDVMRELVNILQTQLEMLKDERDYLREQWQQEREARLEAEKRAARYEPVDDQD